MENNMGNFFFYYKINILRSFYIFPLGLPLDNFIFAFVLL